MAQVSLPRVERRSPVEFLIDRVWRFFCSVRAAVYEIVVLAVLVLIGTLRQSTAPAALADAVPVLEPVVRRWYAWDVFHSMVFAGVLTLIAVAIAICTINRVPGIWRTIARPTVGTSHGFLRGADTTARFDSTVGAGELVEQIVSTLRARRYRVLTERRGAEVHLYADKHRYAKLATFPFHLALILILVGGLVGARWGFRESAFLLPEGSVRGVGHGTGLSVGLENLTETYREDGTAKEYRSELTLYRDGEAIESGSITVNNPLTHGNVVFYQSGFGQAAVLNVTDAGGRMVFADALELGPFQDKLNPDAPAGQHRFDDLGLTLNVIAPDANPLNRPELDTRGVQTGQMFVQVIPDDLRPGEEPPSAMVNVGEAVAVGGLTVGFERERRFTVLQVGRNPGIPIFFVAAFLLVGGLAATFYFPHRRVRGIVGTAIGGGASALLAPLAKRDWSGQREFGRLVADVEQRLGMRAKLIEPAPERTDRRSGIGGSEEPATAVARPNVTVPVAPGSED